MVRRVAIQKPADNGAPPPATSKVTPGIPGEIDFAAEPAAPANAATGYGAKDAGEVDGIIAGIISLSPRKLNESLERSQRVGSRDLSVLFKALDDEDTHVREAFNLAFIARRLAGRLKVEEVTLKIRLKAEAEEKAPRKENKDRSLKALTADNIADYYRGHPELIAMRAKLVDYEAYAEHCEKMASRRAFRSKSIEGLLEAARATGTGKTSGYGETGSDRS